ncbi:transducin beta-like protein 3 [Patella vulgata]|uniref:transducin beta-like protein 3 n=1 Tax=Patella vulgata TaxID=6465 RepID=UPI0024A82E13|nr:transducin beta-like protein 3 [Patella vulgata]
MTQLKSSFKIETKLEAFYTEGKIEISRNGQFMFCGCGQKVQMLDIQTSNLAATFSKEEEVVTNFILSPDDQYLIIASQNLLLRQWNWKDKKLIRSWRAIHRTPVISMAFDTTSTLLATGSTDFTIKVWDIIQEHCTHDLIGHKGVICALAFNPSKSRLQLVSAADDNMIRIWDLVTSTCVNEIQAHYSTVTSLVFTPDGDTMYSTARDSVVVTWDMKEIKVLKTVPVFERIESLMILDDTIDYSQYNVDDTSPYYVIAGNKGTLSICFIFVGTLSIYVLYL